MARLFLGWRPNIALGLKYAPACPRLLGRTTGEVPGPWSQCLTAGVHPKSLCPVLCPPPSATECYRHSTSREQPIEDATFVAFSSN